MQSKKGQGERLQVVALQQVGFFAKALLHWTMLVLFWYCKESSYVNLDCFAKFLELWKCYGITSCLLCGFEDIRASSQGGQRTGVKYPAVK